MPKRRIMYIMYSFVLCGAFRIGLGLFWLCGMFGGMVWSFLRLLV